MSQGAKPDLGVDSVWLRCAPLAALSEAGAALGWTFTSRSSADGDALRLVWSSPTPQAPDWTVVVRARLLTERAFAHTDKAQVSYQGEWSREAPDWGWKKHTLDALLAWADGVLASAPSDAPKSSGLAERVGLHLTSVGGKPDAAQSGQAQLPATLCALPFVALDVDPDGQFRPCCLFGDALRDAHNLPFSVQTTDAASVWNSADLQRVRSAMLRGERLPACSRCWEVEQHRGVSKRQTANYEQPRGSVATAVTEPRLRSLTLYPSTRCNLRCRTCSPESSSAIALEYTKLARRSPELAPLLTPTRATAVVSDWLEGDPHFFRGLEPTFHGLERLEFLGGEPLLSDGHFDLLERVVREGTAGQVALHYSTNGTVLPHRVRDLWPHFALVSLKVSLDAVGAHFGYLRYPARWELVVDNIAAFRTVGPKVRVDVNATPSALSILGLPDLIAWAAAERLYLSLNSLSGSRYLDPRVLPLPAKRAARARFASMPVTVNATLFREVQAMLAQMDAEDWSAELPTLLLHTAALDRARGQSFGDTFPELAELLAWAPAAPTKPPTAVQRADS